MKKDIQNQTPFFTKLKQYAKSNVAPFDVPGHKLGRIPNALINYVGQKTYLLDANAPLGLDHLNEPRGVIKKSQDLMAKACHADKAYFLTNGTTTGILAMVMSACKANDKIILPRNVHKSVINGLILSGALPVFVKPNIDKNLGIANDVTFDVIKKVIDENPDAKAVFVINPTYFGVVSDLERITEYAHRFNMMVLVDEAHGAQYYFSDKLPKSAMDAGCDMAAASMHKTAGSFTQSSIILTKGDKVNHSRLRAALNILQSTSPSSLLLASLDVARKTMYFEGAMRIEHLLNMAKITRNKINQIPGISTYDAEYFKSIGSFAFDETKLIIKVSDLGLSGFEVYTIMRRKYNIQLELAESHIVLAVLTIGTTKMHLDRLILAFKKLSLEYYKQRDKLPKIEFQYQFPETYSRPMDAFHAPKLIVSVDDALDEIAAESVMIYPPGIPIVIPGEVITKEVIEQMQYYLKKGSALLSDLEGDQIQIVDKENWLKWEGWDDEF